MESQDTSGDDEVEAEAVDSSVRCGPGAQHPAVTLYKQPIHSCVQHIEMMELHSRTKYGRIPIKTKGVLSDTRATRFLIHVVGASEYLVDVRKTLWDHATIWQQNY